MDLTTRISELAGPAAREAGLELDGVTVTSAGKRSRVVVTVDLPESEVGAADLDTVAVASRAIGAALDDANVPSTPYTLEVSTPGADRPLTERRHFMRARTRKVALSLADGGELTGVLQEVDGDVLVIATDAATERVAIADVTAAAVVIEMRRLD
ncbi:ribosome maturation factor RimP [Demequina muriae]|uniref:Ribosome maturation factor RimP n=1 Tax=Demequina muriae TaxID=3051664 RepID=A0ABT8GDS5_9MICO|nr:ribosome maturation factor RimP [Demequina sp. EGI L300058]MDN4479585.1 ribosome maturation factor RimP [Demequina sp. EGI L300058]